MAKIKIRVKIISNYLLIKAFRRNTVRKSKKVKRTNGKVPAKKALNSRSDAGTY